MFTGSYKRIAAQFALVELVDEPQPPVASRPDERRAGNGAPAGLVGAVRVEIDAFPGVLEGLRHRVLLVLLEGSRLDARAQVRQPSAIHRGPPSSARRSSTAELR